MTQPGIQYGQALYDLASDEGLTGQILEQLHVLREVFAAEPQFLRLLTAPNIPKQERCAVVDESFRDRVHPYVLNFLKLLTERGYARYFGDCCKTFENQYDLNHGILRVWAVTAQPLTQDQTHRLIKKISSITGKNVRLENQTDPTCLGGVCLRYDGKQVDGTVQHRLETLGQILRDTVL